MYNVGIAIDYMCRRPTWMTYLDTGSKRNQLRFPRYVEPIVECLAAAAVEFGLHLIELDMDCRRVASIVIDRRQEQGLNNGFDHRVKIINNVLVQQINAP